MAKEKSKVLILKGQPHSLKAVEVFLRNRELDFYSTSSIKEALAYLIKEKPKYFLMAADHPNKKIRQLPQLISRSFSTTVLGFAESSNNSSLYALQELNAEYVLYPPVSGPAIIRTLSRVSKEIETKRNQVKTVTERISRYDLTRPDHSKNAGEKKPLSKNEDFDFLGELKGLFAGEPTSEPAATVGQNYLFIPSANVEVAKTSSNESARKIAKVIQETLESMRPIPLESGPVVPVGATSKISCLVVDAGETKGYLLVAFGDNRPMDQNFMESIRHGLVKHIEACGDGLSPLVQLKPMEISTQEIEFLKWAQGQTEFLMTTNYGESQVVAAFLPNDHIQSRLIPSRDKAMCEVFLDQVDTETQLEYDVFVYLPANAKYILYGKRGGKIYSEQKQRLMANGVTRMHLRREDVDAFYRQQAAGYINARMENRNEAMAA